MTMKLRLKFFDAPGRAAPQKTRDEASVRACVFTGAPGTYETETDADGRFRVYRIEDAKNRSGASTMDRLRGMNASFNSFWKR